MRPKAEDGGSPTTPELDQFLRATDLDDAQSAASRLREVPEADQQEIRRILDGWIDTQGVANLLVFPDLIPAEARRDALMRGLSEPAHSYLALAALVGVQKEGSSLPDGDRAAATERVCELAMQGPPATARRASRTLYELASAAYGARIGGLLMHPDATVRHNIVAALVRLLGVEGARKVVDSLLEQHLIFGEEKRYAETQLQEVESSAADEMNSAATPLLSYIPNLTDFESG